MISDFFISELGLDSYIPNRAEQDRQSGEDGKAFIFFSHIGKGLFAKGKYGYVRGFEIAGADRIFYYGQAKIEGDLKKQAAAEARKAARESRRK